MTDDAPLVELAAASSGTPEAMAPSADGMASMEMSGDNPHDPGSAMHMEHMALMNLVDTGAASHVAVASGDWFDPATWGGSVPGAGAKVWIPEGVSVAYDAVSDTALFTVRVDGALTFATDTDTRMVVDTMVVTKPGLLEIGTAANPVGAGVSAEIVIANNGAIDVGWDPMLLSRGVIAHGTVEMHGAAKETHLKVATDPMAGDTSITLAEVPAGWQIGDKIVIAGTHYDGYKWDGSKISHHLPEDEVRVITAISGNEVFFDGALVHDHDTPRADLKTSVANYSRSITISTEDHESAATHERGHVMFMHSDAIDVRYVALEGLGRTDKSVDARDASSFSSIEPDSNVKGRYSLHVHRAGLEDPENPAMLVGNAVWTSPGWGIVHHDSNAELHANATYDTFGAGIVAESGNETGTWTGNIAIYAKGISWQSPKNGNNSNDPDFDMGRTGDGFWFQGRLIEAYDNVAASVNTGFVYAHRGVEGDGKVMDLDAASFAFPEALHHDPEVNFNHPPILLFADNETFAAREGLLVFKGNPNQGHDVHSHLTDFTAWSVVSGIDLQYTSHYLVENADVIAKVATVHSDPGIGISLGNNLTDVTVVNATTSGFETGLYAAKTSTFPTPADWGIAVVGGDITGSRDDIVGLSSGEVLSSLPGNAFSVDVGQLTYREGTGATDRRVVISGTKTDSLGTTALPAGSDSYDVRYQDVLRLLELNGWYETASGQRVFVLEAYYSDRGTGEIFKFGHVVEIDPNVPLGVGGYANAGYNGILDLSSAAPVAAGDVAATGAGQDVVIDLVSNDSDPDGDPVRVDGIVQPARGRVFDNGDGTVTYRPDFGFAGTDSFRYWVTDGQGNFTPATVTVEVGAGVAPPPPPPNTAPVIGDPATFDVEEGALPAGTVVASDADGDALSYSIAGGPDAGAFTIDAATGALAFRTAPDFEAPSDADGDNVYTLDVTVSDGQATTRRTIQVNVADVAEPPPNTAPVIGDPATFDVAEGTLAAGAIVATDADGDALAYAIAGGPDAGAFAIDAATGALALRTAPDFEAPSDADGDNVYTLDVAVSDGQATTRRTITVTVTDVAEPPPNTAPVIGDPATFDVAEGTLAAGAIVATDADGDALAYAIAGGPDAGAFTIDAATGALALRTAPDFEAPSDADGDNVYTLDVAVSDGQATTRRTIQVTVTDVADTGPTEIDAGGGTFDAGAVLEPVAGLLIAVLDPTGPATTFGAGGDGPMTGQGYRIGDGDAEVTVVNAAAIVGGAGGDTMTGGDAREIFHGEAGDDILTGGNGVDTLFGGDGADLLDPGAGIVGARQLLSGGDGGDTYRIGVDAQIVRIAADAETLGGTGTDRVILPDLARGDVTVILREGEAQGGLLLWSIGAGQGAVDIQHEFAAIETFVFADGAIDGATLAASPDRIAYFGTDGDDVLTGTGLQEIFYGGAGVDTLIGGNGNDTLDPGAGSLTAVQNLAGQQGNDLYMIGADSGISRISTYAERKGHGKADRVVFTDLAFDQIDVLTLDFGDADGVQLVLHWDTGDQVGQLRIAEMGTRIESFRFADGTVMGAKDFEPGRLTITGTDGDDELTGWFFDEVLLGGAGVDTLIGGAGDDVLDAGTGNMITAQSVLGHAGDDTYLIGRDSGAVRLSSFAEWETSGVADRVIFGDLTLSDLAVSLRDTGGADGIALRLDWAAPEGRGYLSVAHEGTHIEVFEFADGTVVTADELLMMV